MSIKKVILWIAMLVFIDQIIKIIINKYFFDYRFEIIPSLFEFRPVFNGKGPYYFHLLNLNINLIIITVFNAVILGLVSIWYNKVRRAKNSILLLDFAFIFFVAVFVCSIISFTVWEKGCLDYIYLKPLFVFDLKDLYGNCCTCLSLVFAYKYRTFKSWSQFTKSHE
jgi:hypothetical protein